MELLFVLVKGRQSMTFEYVSGAVLAVLLAAYLVYALLRPERF